MVVLSKFRRHRLLGKADPTFTNPMTDCYQDIYLWADLEREKNRLMFNRNRVKRNKRMIRRYHLEDLALNIKRFTYRIKRTPCYEQIAERFTSTGILSLTDLVILVLRLSIGDLYLGSTPLVTVPIDEFMAVFPHKEVKAVSRKPASKSRRKRKRVYAQQKKSELARLPIPYGQLYMCTKAIAIAQVIKK